jgi:hypothetical protein
LIGSPGLVWSSAWIWLFSSIDNTTAWAGGSTHGSGLWPARGQAPSPTMSVSLAAKLGSRKRLKVRNRCGCNLCACQMRGTAPPRCRSTKAAGCFAARLKPIGRAEISEAPRRDVHNLTPNSTPRIPMISHSPDMSLHAGREKLLRNPLSFHVT